MIITRGLVVLAMVGFVAGCASPRSDHVRRAALIVADEVRADIEQWDSKIEAEMKYYRNVGTIANQSIQKDVGLRNDAEKTALTSDLLDDALVDKKGASAGSLRTFLKAAHDRSRDEKGMLEKQKKEALAKLQVSLASITYARSTLESIEKDLRAVASESNAEIRRRMRDEWIGRLKVDYEALKKAVK